MGKVTILCSGFGLGFYIPGVMLKNQFEHRNIEAEVDVFEYYMEDDKKGHINDNKDTYHNNFAKAIVASKIPMDIRKSIDYDKVDQLLTQWKEEDRKDFILLSGHWLVIVDLYRERMHGDIHVDSLYVDSTLAPSWKSFYKCNKEFDRSFHEVNLYQVDDTKMNFTIGVDGYEPIPYSSREHKLVVHGGGWGMGTYQEKIPALLNSGYSLNIVAYNENENQYGDKVKYMMNDPMWCAWEKDCNGVHDFPPYIEFEQNEEIKYPAKKENHWLLDITNGCKAIVAKPGAGTLLDSFITETPLVLLEPFGKHEKTNYQVWENLGFGVSYQKFEESGYSEELLDQLHKNLAEHHAQAKQYVDDFISRNRK